MRKLVFLLAAAMPAWALAQGALPRVAVTDLAYEESVSQYFNYVSYKDKQDWNDSGSSSAAGNAANANFRSSGKRDTELVAASGEITRIDRGEVRKMTADIRGAMLNSRMYRLVQARPYLDKEPVDEKSKTPVEKMLPSRKIANEKLFDIIARIKRGDFPNADYVLFLTVSSVEPRQELNPIQGSNATSFSLSLELLVDCNLINTKTYEIKAAFSAMGEGQDMRILNAPGQLAHLSKTKVMREVSKSLAEDVATQLEAQFDPTAGRGGRNRECAPNQNPAQCEGAAAKVPDRVIEYR